jgi:hypothetical protein
MTVTMIQPTPFKIVNAVIGIFDLIPVTGEHETIARGTYAPIRLSYLQMDDRITEGVSWGGRSPAAPLLGLWCVAQVFVIWVGFDSGLVLG